MGEEGLKACALCNIHNDILDRLDISAITDEWFGRSKTRLERFVLSKDSLRKLYNSTSIILLIFYYLLNISIVSIILATQFFLVLKYGPRKDNYLSIAY